MSPAARKKRLKTFEKKAQQFKQAVKRKDEQTTQTITRDSREIVIGRKQNKGLIFKRNIAEVRVVRFLESKLIEFYNSKNIKPKTYQLHGLQASELGVQEYKKTPTILSLRHYLFLKQQKRKMLLAKFKEDYFICKKFVNEFKLKITMDELEKVEFELNNHLKEATKKKIASMISPSNILILGRNRDGRLRIAIIDV